jgi:diguanylate cyclase (GGDEF)-like protein
MRTNNSYFGAGSVMASKRLYDDEIAQSGSSAIPRSGEASKRRILSLDRWRPKVEEYVEEMPPSSLDEHERELARILDEAEQITEALKSGDPDTQALHDTLQRTVLYAVKQSLLDRELRSMALTDDLTGLQNRRAFLALAGQQLRVMRRKTQPLLLFFADVDNLKEINDTYGHHEGDVALIRAADALEETFRKSDIIARMGGDEFAILALEASGEDREAILRRLEKNLNGSSANESHYELSLSVGMARFDPKHAVSLGKLVAAADEAMYEEKKKKTRLIVT